MKNQNIYRFRRQYTLETDNAFRRKETKINGAQFGNSSDHERKLNQLNTKSARYLI